MKTISLNQPEKEVNLRTAEATCWFCGEGRVLEKQKECVESKLNYCSYNRKTIKANLFRKEIEVFTGEPKEHRVHICLDCIRQLRELIFVERKKEKI